MSERMDENGLVHDAERLKELQALPLDRKIQISIARIIEWYQAWGGNVCVSFSGGKDSTVLLHLVRSIFPDVPAVYADTGLEYPEVKEFIKSIPNVVIVRPEESFVQVLTERGYPLISKEVAECAYYARKPYRLPDATPHRKQGELLGMRISQTEERPLGSSVLVGVGGSLHRGGHASDASCFKAGRETATPPG